MIDLQPSASVVVRRPRARADEREGSRAPAARRFVHGAGSRRSLAMHLRNCGSRAARSSPTFRRKSASRARTRVFAGDIASGKSLGARYYAPWLGRWTTADPLGLQAGLNLYLYGRASPVVMVDPNGMESLNAADQQRQTAAKIDEMNQAITAAAGRALKGNLAQSRGKLHDTGVAKAAAGGYLERVWGFDPFTVGKQIDQKERDLVFGIARALKDPEQGLKDAAAAYAESGLSAAAKHPVIGAVLGVAEGKDKLLTIANEAKPAAERVRAATSMLGGAAQKVATALSAGFGARPEPVGTPIRGAGGGGPDGAPTGGGGGGGGPEPRLVAGGGRAPGFPELKPGDVSLNVDPGAAPHHVADVRSTPFSDATFGRVKFERLPHDLVTDRATLFETHRIMKPGGVLEIITGRGVSRAGLETALEEAGFTMTFFKSRAETRARAVR